MILLIYLILGNAMGKMPKDTWIGKMQDLKLKVQKIPEMGKLKAMILSFELPPPDKLWSCTHALLTGNQQTYHEVHGHKTDISTKLWMHISELDLYTHTERMWLCESL